MQKYLKCRKFEFQFDFLLLFSGILSDVVKTLSVNVEDAQDLGSEGAGRIAHWATSIIRFNISKISSWKGLSSIEKSSPGKWLGQLPWKDLKEM